MLGKYFKVTEDFAPETPSKDGEYLAAEKGDIIFDVIYVDNDYVQAKSMISQRAGKIPRKCIEELQGETEEEKEGEKEAVETTEPVNDTESEATDNNKTETTANTVAISTGKPANLPRPPPSQRSMGSFKKPELPKRPAPRCKRTNSMPVTSSFRSRASDEGYNSSSTYSGEKQGQPSKSSDDDCFVDTPLLQSQRPRSLSPALHKMSIQDEDGYEVPMIISKPGLKIQGDDTIERKPKLRFIFRKKLELRNGKDAAGGFEEGQGIFRMGCGNSSGFSTPSDPSSPTHSPLKRRNRRRERLVVLSCILISLLLAMGMFLILLILLKLSTLLSLVIATIIFNCTLVIPLSVSKGRLLCMLSLVLPSLFSNKVKTALCVTLAALLVIGPVFNISTNLDLVIRCGIDPTTSVKLSKQNTNTPGSTGAAPTRQGIRPTKPAVLTAAYRRAMMNISAMKAPSGPRNDSELINVCKQSFNTVQEMCLSTQDVIQETCKSSVQSKNSGDSPTFCLFGVNEICHSRLSIHELCTTFVERRQVKRPPKSRPQSKTAAMRRAILELLPLFVLVLFFDAYYYTQGYLADKNQDNVYITGKLKVIDQERKERGLKERLFPLRKLEFRRYCLPSSINLTASEKRSVFRWLCVCTIVGLFVLCLVLLDSSIFNALASRGEPRLSHTCANMRYTQTDHSVVRAMYVVFGILVGFSLFQGHVLRLRGRICASFYPKRETVRGVHLYYKVLQERAYFWKNCREKVRISAEARRLRWRTGVAHRIFACLPATVRRAISKLFIYRCMICGSHTCHRSFVCADRACSAVFCYECYIDMGESCISCQPSHQATFSLGSPI